MYFLITTVTFPCVVPTSFSHSVVCLMSYFRFLLFVLMYCPGRPLGPAAVVCVCVYKFHTHTTLNTRELKIKSQNSPPHLISSHLAPLPPPPPWTSAEVCREATLVLDPPSCLGCCCCSSSSEGVLKQSEDAEDEEEKREQESVGELLERSGAISKVTAECLPSSDT